MGYWKSKVLPKIKRVFEKNGRKAAAAEACKSFDGSKEDINKDFEEKKTELQPKVVEIYEASSTDIKTVVKERTEAGVKKHSVEVQKFLEELVKIDFPGSKQVAEASSKFGPAFVSGPVLFVFEKVSTFIVTEESTPTETTTTTETKEKEIVIGEEKGKEVATEEEKAVEEVAETAATAAASADVPPEPVKVEGEAEAAPKP
ncbi:Plasma membrane-associated cation-binding protein 1 [Acorus gramineus]|uniref:Plasma membrane-associated cation-binding protein 1 n=1 Tax=Acorus gramineus TaxID=55184 RepID=A0AAV9AWE6_ACOGR|nr:Plasma membrane-associated cation-binding protein 1 [Acorus gramineus]